MELAEGNEQSVVRRTTVAYVLHQFGRLDEALAEFEAAEQEEKAMLPALRGYHYCDLLLDRSRHEEVITRAAAGITGSMQANSLFEVGLYSVAAARACLAIKAIDRARQYAGAGEHYLRRAGQIHYMPYGLCASAEFARVTADWPRAESLLREAHDLTARVTQQPLLKADVLLEWARLDDARGRRDDAREHRAEAREIIVRSDYGRRRAEIEQVTSAP